MAKLRVATAQEIPEIQNIFTEAWNFLKRFYYLKQDSGQEEWNECLRAYSRVAQMGTTPSSKELASALAQTVFRYIEFRSKERD